MANYTITIDPAFGQLEDFPPGHTRHFLKETELED